MLKRWIKRIKKFFRADILKECSESVVRENISMLCMVNLAMGMFALMLCGYIGVEELGKKKILGTYLTLFIFSVVLFAYTRKIAIKKHSRIPWVIVMDYFVWAFCITGENLLAGDGMSIASYYPLMALSCCFLIKPAYLILLQIGSATFVNIYIFASRPFEQACSDTQAVSLMMCLSIVLGLWVMHLRMKFLKKREEKEKIVQVKVLYQSILDETETGVYVRDRNTYELLYINRKACEIFGVNAQQAVGKRCFYALYHQREACKECPARFSNMESAPVADVAFGEHTYAVKGKRIDWSGREAYVEYLIDVTDAKKVSEQMRLANDNLTKKYEEEVLYRNKAVSADILAFARLNLTGGIVEELCVGKKEGYEEQFPSAMQFTDHIKSFCKETWLLEEQEERLCREALLAQYRKGVTKVSEEYIAKLYNGKHVWTRVEISLVQRPETSEILAFVYHRDVTREHMLGNVVECILSFEYDEIYTIDSVNKEYELLAVGQYALDEQQVAGSYAQKLTSLEECAVSEEDKARICREMNIETLSETLHKETTHMLEVTLMSKSGKARRKRVRCMYLYEEVGIILVTITDIDDVVRAEKEKQEQLEEALHFAREASRAKSRFLASMSHEIRTPMNAIIGLNSIIKDNISNSEQVFDCSEKLDSASKYLLALLNDILDMSRIESGNMVLAHQPFDGQRFWENVNVLAQAQADLSGVEYLFERKCEVSGIYLGDATRLQQIMINLINNAIKFTDEHGYVRVCVSESRDAEGRAAMDVSVEDNGIGISEEFLPQVFGTFTQQYADNTTAYKGSGLGLSIARNFARMMDGDITVTSKEGVGTKFLVHVVLDMDENLSDEEEDVDTSEERMFDGKVVLLVEDHPLNTIVAKNLLDKRGFTVVHAESGEEALGFFEESSEWEFDVVLMDIRMPGMDGIEATKRIRALTREDAKNVPIIAMTANAYEEDRKHTAEAGMNAHLAKPIDPKQLFRTLDTFIPQV